MSDGEGAVPEDLAQLPAPAFFLEHAPAPKRNGFAKRFLAPLLAPAAPIDWRARGWTGPVRFQGSCQSCSAHAVAAAIEGWANRKGSPRSVSGPFLHACVAAVACGQGADPMRILRNGVGRSAPAYVDSSPWPEDRCDVGGSALPRLRQVADEADAKSALSASSPVAASLQIAANFRDPATRTYTPQGAAVGDHTICLVGFDDHGWIAQNSYGAGWGDGGFFRIGYGVGALLRDGYSAVCVA